MLSELIDIAEFDHALLTQMPLWVSVPLLCVWLLPLVLCLHFDRRALISPLVRSRNTIHTAFWLTVILMVPVFGSMLYLAGSVLPAVLHKRRTGSDSVPGTFPLRRRQLLTLCMAGAAACVLAVVTPILAAKEPFSGISHILTQNWVFEITFLCFTYLLLTDWIWSVRRPALYLYFTPEQTAPVSKGTLFGVPYLREEGTRITAPAILREEAVRARQTANMLFRHHVYGAEMVGRKDNIESDGRKYRCQVLGIRGHWLESTPDFMEMRYIGKGITRCRVCIWDADGDDRKCTEKVLYRAVPECTGWLIRAGILLTVQMGMGSVWACTLHRTVMELFARIG